MLGHVWQTRRMTSFVRLLVVANSALESLLKRIRSGFLFPPTARHWETIKKNMLGGCKKDKKGKGSGKNCRLKRYQYYIGKKRIYIYTYIYIPGTQMTVVLIGKGIVFWG